MFVWCARCCLCGQRDRNLSGDVFAICSTTLLECCSVRLTRCDVCVLCGVASGAARCRIFASCVRAFASVHAVETLQRVGTRRRRKCRTIPRAMNMFLTCLCERQWAIGTQEICVNGCTLSLSSSARWKTYGIRCVCDVLHQVVFDGSVCSVHRHRNSNQIC